MTILGNRFSVRSLVTDLTFSTNRGTRRLPSRLPTKRRIADRLLGPFRSCNQTQIRSIRDPNRAKYVPSGKRTFRQARLCARLETRLSILEYCRSLCTLRVRTVPVFYSETKETGAVRSRNSGPESDLTKLTRSCGTSGVRNEWLDVNTSCRRMMACQEGFCGYGGGV